MGRSGAVLPLVERALPWKCCVTTPPSTLAGWSQLAFWAPIYSVCEREWNCYLLPHTTHECQPLDVGLFGPLKRHWQQECHKFYQKHPSLVISKLNFYLVFRQAWLNAVSPANICRGFKELVCFPTIAMQCLCLKWLQQFQWRMWREWCCEWRWS